VSRSSTAEVYGPYVNEELVGAAKPARDLLAKLGIDPPRQIHELTPGT
jgi:aryl-alcohol dehydrogenase-like predicted oxidoreductase